MRDKSKGARKRTENSLCSDFLAIRNAGARHGRKSRGGTACVIGKKKRVNLERYRKVT